MTIPISYGAVSDIASGISVEPAALLAVIDVESGGVVGEKIGGKLEPIIRYEGHYFDRLCDPKVRAAARRAGVSSPVAGRIKNPKTQAGRWELLLRAAKFDARAAYEATSWGVGQVMGAHWHDLGFSSVDAFVADARSGVAGQVQIMADFIKFAKLADDLRARDWSAFARGYNGPNYRANGYDDKLAAAYRKYERNPKPLMDDRDGNLRLGSKGPGVREVQALLAMDGFNVKVDGDFGPATKTAVKAFQGSNMLAADGVVGPKTQAALSALRAAAPRDAGQRSTLAVPGVQKGLAGALAVPALVATTKDQLQSVADQLAPYASLDHINAALTSTLAALTVAGIVIGGGVALYHWWKERTSYTGTKLAPPPRIIVTPTGEQPISLPPAGA